MCDEVTERLWLRKLLTDFDFNVDTITFYEDNQGCISLIKNPCNNKRGKHIDLKYKFVCDNRERNPIEICYMESRLQHADLFTKGLQYDYFFKLRYEIGVRDFGEERCCVYFRNSLSKALFDL